MKKLIELGAAIDAVHRNYDTILDFRSDGETVANSVEDILSELPIVDAVPVVRCKDCRHWSGRKYNVHINGFLPWCRFSALQCEANDFCSYGERKEDRSHEQRGEKAQKGAGTGAPEAEDQGAGAQL